jgi:hypothetical protein
MLRIEGNQITIKDVEQIGKFLATYFTNRKDLISVFIEQGVENMKVEEVEKVFNKCFEGQEHFITKVKI